MSLDPLNHVLKGLEKQAAWREQQQFKHLVSCWAEVVGPAVAAQTRPTGIQRQVLRVATSSSAWAQNLSFERQRILAKLNGRLAQPLQDIRFSAAQWQESGSRNAEGSQSPIWRNHPSRVLEAEALGETPTDGEREADAQQAFQRWATRIQRRSQQLPRCPRCQCPTPPGEIERWSVCALCATQAWQF